MEYGDRLRNARTAKGYSQQQLAEVSGVPQGTISKIERGDQQTSRYDLALSEALEVSAKWLQTGHGQKSPHSNLAETPARYSHQTATAPVISQVQVGQWAEAIDLYEPGDGIEHRLVPTGTSENAIWLQVVGDSMTNPNGNPSIPEGSIVLVDPDISPDNGKLVVAKLVDSNEVTLKKLVIDAGRKWLKPLNPAYPMIEINGNCNIVGVVKRMEYDF